MDLVNFIKFSYQRILTIICQCYQFLFTNFKNKKKSKFKNILKDISLHYLQKWVVYYDNNSVCLIDYEIVYSAKQEIK